MANRWLYLVFVVLAALLAACGQPATPQTQAQTHSPTVEALAVTPGTVVGWGDNSNGQINFAGVTNVTAIAAGYGDSLALKSDGTMVGRGATTIPADLTNVKAIAAGEYHNLALKQDGTVVAWGWNGRGQTNIPAGLSNVKAIAAGRFVSLALVGPSDSTAPTISITTPSEAAKYLQYQPVNASYSCQDESGGSGLATCVGSVANGAAISTAVVGAKTFTVNASDNAGNPRSKTVNYSVISASTATGNLITQVNALNLEKNTAKSLVSLLQNVQADLAKNNKAGALDKLNSFISQVNAQRGKKISSSDADKLIAAANLVIQSIQATP